ncbi:MAG: hypothetical protein M3Z05_15830 [Gemmatimonadota bacterium]|nr:hypothetical protein [Gemmatimonadota bacterium]
MLVPRQRWVPIDPVAMVALDSTVTTFDLSAVAPVARGSIVTDASGTGRATMIFEQGTQATLTGRRDP